MKRKLFSSIIIILSLMACSSTSSVNKVDRKITGQESTVSGKVFSDVHVHLFPGSETSKEHLASLMEQSYFEKALILSPGYYPNLEDKVVKEYNKMTADEISPYDDKLYGLCGLSRSLKDMATVLSDCLNFENMIGIKMRLAEMQAFKEIELHFERVRQALSQHKNKLSVFLIHMPDLVRQRNMSEEDWGKSKEEHFKAYLLLLDIAKTYPNIQFVVAHSAYSPRIINLLAEKVEELNLSNLWLEVSAIFIKSFRGGYGIADNGYVSSWDLFGLEKILFGSDQLIGKPYFSNPMAVISGRDQLDTNFVMLSSQIDSMKKLGLKEKDLSLILWENGKKFFEIIKSGVIAQ